MQFELTESNRHGMSGTAIILGLILVGSAVAFGCTDSDDPSPARQTRETLIRPASTTSETPRMIPAVSNVSTGSEVGEATPPKTIVPDNVSFEDGEAAYRAGDYDRAVVLFEAYVERKPTNAWGHYMLGLSARKAGEQARAVDAFEEALVIDPDHVKSHFNLGRTLLDLGRPEEALAEFETGIELTPESGEGYRLLGRGYQRLGDTESAVEAYREALVLSSEDAWAMNNLALIFIEGGRGEDAIGPAARAAQLRDDLAFIQNNLGMALELTGRHSQAAQAYRGALTIDPEYTKAEVNLARVEGFTGYPDVEAIDLDSAAQEFIDGIDAWRTPDVSEFIPELIETEPIVRDTVDEVLEGVGSWN